MSFSLSPASTTGSSNEMAEIVQADGAAKRMAEVWAARRRRAEELAAGCTMDDLRMLQEIARGRVREYREQLRHGQVPAANVHAYRAARNTWVESRKRYMLAIAIKNGDA